MSNSFLRNCHSLGHFLANLGLQLQQSDRSDLLSTDRRQIPRAKPSITSTRDASVICIHADPHSDPMDLVNAIKEFSLKRDRAAKADAAAPGTRRDDRPRAAEAPRRGRHGRRRHGRVSA